MKKIIEFRIKNFVDNNKQNQGLIDLHTVFKKLESYSFVIFLIMVVIYQLLLIWIRNFRWNRTIEVIPGFQNFFETVFFSKNKTQFQKIVRLAKW
jgi:hypothetical protein